MSDAPVQGFTCPQCGNVVYEGSMMSVGKNPCGACVSSQPMSDQPLSLNERRAAVRWMCEPEEIEFLQNQISIRDREIATLEAERDKTNREITQKLACIQILAGGDEPNIVSEFPAANDVRKLANEKRRLDAELTALREAAEYILKHAQGDDDSYSVGSHAMRLLAIEVGQRRCDMPACNCGRFHAATQEVKP